MCRLYAFRANEPTRVKCSLVDAQNALLNQSVSDQRGRSNADGWGVSCYENSIPWVVRRGTAAYRDKQFSSTAERIYARAVVAHVRDATVGLHSVFNSHPFTWGPWSFAHNGTLQGFESLEPELLEETDEDLRGCRMGQTDSEVIFFWLLTRLRRIDGEHGCPLPDFDGVMNLLGESLPKLDERSRNAGASRPSRLNFILTNGQELYATRFRNTLYCMEQDHEWRCDICGRNHRHGLEHPHYRAVTIASEPISAREWKSVSGSSVIGVNAQMQVGVRRF